jgi:fatty-acyl-CoA synthase
VTAPELTPRAHAQNSPDRPAIIMGGSGEVVTFGQLDDTSRRLAQAFRSRGLGEGDHVAILMENCPQFLEVAWAAQRSGLYYTAINGHLRANEVQYVLEDSGASALITSAVMAELVNQLDVSRLQTRICVGGDLQGFEPYDDVVAAASPAPLEDDREGREMLYSSGTTGQPKGVRKPIPGTSFGDPTAEPVRVAQGVAALGAGPGAVYLSTRCRCSGPVRRSSSWSGSTRMGASP